MNPWLKKFLYLAAIYVATAGIHVLFGYFFPIYPGQGLDSWCLTLIPAFYTFAFWLRARKNEDWPR